MSVSVKKVFEYLRSNITLKNYKYSDNSKTAKSEDHCLPSLMMRVPPSVGVLGVGRVTAAGGGVTPLTPPPS